MKIKVHHRKAIILVSIMFAKSADRSNKTLFHWNYLNVLIPHIHFQYLCHFFLLPFHWLNIPPLWNWFNYHLLIHFSGSLLQFHLNRLQFNFHYHHLHHSRSFHLTFYILHKVDYYLSARR